MARKPAVAGTFYQSDQTLILSEIEHAFLNPHGPGRLPVVNRQRIGKVMGLVCPHAGYVYSGGAAAYCYDRLASDGLPDTIIIIGPNHQNLGERVAVGAEERWITPLGVLHIDEEVAESISELSKYAVRDDSAHSKEHSIEVQLPFLQYLKGHGVKIVPIVLSYWGMGDALDLMEDMSETIAKALKGKDAVIIASTDFTHYESKETAYARDAIAMDSILRLDGDNLIKVVYDNDITMCGVLGTAIMIETCKKLGANRSQKLTYYTSGDVTGDHSHVVGYGAISIEREFES